MFQGASRSTAGYRLHKERILFSGGSVVRSVKYPLMPVADNSETRKYLIDFEQALRHDSLKIRGDLNLTDYLEFTGSGNNLYTVFDFWVDSLKAGVIFQPKSNELINFVLETYGQKTPAALVWEKIDKRIRRLFDRRKFTEKFILPGSIRQGKKTAKSLRRDLIDCLVDDYKTKDEKFSFKITDSRAETLIETVTGGFFSRDGSLILGGEQQQNKFWKDKYGIDKSLLQSRKLAGILEDLTIFVIPELISIGRDESAEVLVELRKKWLAGLKPFSGSEAEIMPKLLGLTDNFNGFSNYFGTVLKILQAEETEKIYRGLETILPEIKRRKPQVTKALEFLSEKSQLLEQPALPGVSSWADYRMDYGGKLQSWYKNSVRRAGELAVQLEKLTGGIGRVKQYLVSSAFPAESEPEKKAIIGLMVRLEKLCTPSILNSPLDYEVFDSVFSALKRRLNFFYQRFIGSDEDEIPVNEHEILKELYMRVFRPMSFFGAASKSSNKKLIGKTISIIEAGIGLISRLLSDLQKTGISRQLFLEADGADNSERKGVLYRRSLNFLWYKYREKALNTAKFREKYELILRSEIASPELWEKIQANSTKYTFLQSRYAKGTLEEVAVKETGDYFLSYQRLMSSLSELLLQVRADFDRNLDSGLLLDWIELAKFCLGQYIRLNTAEKFGLTGLDFGAFPKAESYLKFFGLKEAGKEEFGFLVQSLVLAELRGAATLFSKKRYLVKYAVQVIGSNKRFPLFYHSKSTGLNPSAVNKNPLSEERKKLVNLPHNYWLNLKTGKIKKAKADQAFDLILLSKNNISSFCTSDSYGQDNFFRLASSPYQIQFLDKFISRPSGWEKVGVGLSEWSFVLEKEYRLEWDLTSKKPTFPLLDNSRKNKLYLAVPFSIAAYEQEKTRLKNVSDQRTVFPILGIDVGEYGLAYALLRVKPTALEILAKGFITDTNIARIKDQFSLIQQKAKEGAFAEVSSVVAEVRENAVGALRNRVHLILTENNSSVVYEASISNFETGSGRTTKIYNSVKRSDLYSETDADAANKKRVWGIKKYGMLGKELSAFASSYTCLNCARSLYQLSRQDMERVSVTAREGNIVEFETPLGKAYGFSKPKDQKRCGKGVRFGNTEKSLKEFRKLVKDFARPPLNDKSEVLKKFAGKEVVDGLAGFAKRRGHSAVFVCPFCNHLVDADIQAAVIMAIRGYLNFSGIVQPKRLDGKADQPIGDSYLKATFDYLNGLRIRPQIGL